MQKQKVGWMEEFDVRCFGVMVFRLLGFILRRVCNAEFFANLLIGVARNVAKFSRLVKSFRNIDYQWRHWRCIFCIFLRTLAPLDTNIEIHLFNQGIIGVFYAFLLIQCVMLTISMEVSVNRHLATLHHSVPLFRLANII
ncbi:hypothetical protein WUBG_12242 [Wuchereria bancrofti]|uniref:Uncharacterized protein n=1 Tax=Wuchereria bancrofti TaxID=6293 RepID=J9EIJ6_WUCBA|nr:hypothetical protein WUBG_12242 [Wuchereria bancrofti]